MPYRIDGDNTANILAGSAGADLIYGYDTNAATAAATGLTLTLVAAKAGTTRPLDVDANPLDTTHLFVSTQPGIINVIDLATGEKAETPFLDLTGQVAYREDLGLTSLVFDPEFASNGKLYVYVAVDKVVDGAAKTFNEIWSFTVDPNNPLVADPASKDVIASFTQPGEEHRVGHLAFGPDGYLYLSRGDGNNPYDSFHTAQDTTGANDLLGAESEGLLGKVSRIDVRGDDFPDDPDRDYAIPASNPYAATEGADEIWAVGVRNMWRYSFDRVTGDFYGGNVGQSRWEEVEYHRAGDLPPNFGWGWQGYEGTEPVPPPPDWPDGTPFSHIPTDGLSWPIDTYFHDDANGQYSVTGGYVYRGTNEALQGLYVYADFGHGWLRSLEQTDAIDPATGNPVFTRHDWTDAITYANAGDATLNRPPTFGEDAEGNLYVQDIDGNLFRVDATAPDSGDTGDTITAGDGDDWAFAGAGDDSVLGEDGNDTLSGMLGNDTLHGGTIDDSLLGGLGADQLLGGDGADTLLGGAGDGDLLEGGAGADALDGGFGNNDVAVFAGNREDYLVTRLGSWGFRLEDLRDGSPDGTDVVTGVELFRFADGDLTVIALAATEGPDSLTGTAGGDTLDGRGGDDNVVGLNGDDSLSGGAASDSLSGGAGVDTLTGGAGDDALDGGDSGNDVAVFSGNRADYLITDRGDGSFTVADQRAEAPDGVDTVTGTEVFRFLDGEVPIADLLVTEGPDSLTGTADRDRLHGLGGDDSIAGLDGKDQLYGDDGNDLLIGGAGNDRLFGGLGVDTYIGGAGKDRFRVDRAAHSPTDTPDIITDFSSAERDQIFLKKVANNVEFIDTNDFGATGSAELRYTVTGADARVELDTDGDGSADMAVLVLNVASLAAGDFVLG